MSQDVVAEVVFLSDRRYWPNLQRAWQEGLAAMCPIEADPEEWRASARRLAKHLDCHVHTASRKVKTRANEPAEDRYVAEGNDGFPLGVVDRGDRDAWLKQRSEADA